MQLCRKAVSKNAIIIFAPYWSKKNMSDGYYRRVKISDELMGIAEKIYFDFPKRPQKIKVHYHPKEKRTFVRFGRNRIMIYAIMMILIILTRRVYCESIWQTRKRLLTIPFVKVFIDVHGVVPEEEFLYGKYADAQKYGDIEEAAVRKAAHFFCVSRAMIDHFREKYGEDYIVNSTVLPIFDESLLVGGFADKPKKLKNNKPIITYAGGIFKWQKIELMQFAIKQQLELADYQIYTPTPEKFWETWAGKRPKNMLVKSVTPDELVNKIYKKCHYGFVLRDDIAVNNVACPTKIAEYLKFGIIPIVNTPNIGDFKTLGMKYLTLDDFLAGKLYTEQQRQAIVLHNFECVRKYIELYDSGIKQFKKIMLRG